MNRLEIFKAMIGESHSEFVAGSLQETFTDLNNEKERLIENDQPRTPIWSYDSTAKFLKYGTEYYNRKHNTSNNAFRTEAYCKGFKMNIETEKWVEIEDYLKNENV